MNTEKSTVNQNCDSVWICQLCYMWLAFQPSGEQVKLKNIYILPDSIYLAWFLVSCFGSLLWNLTYSSEPLNFSVLNQTQLPVTCLVFWDGADCSLSWFILAVKLCAAEPITDTCFDNRSFLSVVQSSVYAFWCVIFTRKLLFSPHPPSSSH